MFQRTHTCGELRARHEGQKVRLAGWVRRVRDLGGLAFLDLRDRFGRTQVVFGDEELSEQAHELGREFFVGVEGVVRLRPEKDRNPGMATGDVEVVAESLEIISRSRTPPFLVEDETDASEELRLRFRFLDLRRPRMMKILETRSKAGMLVRNYLAERGFLEIETPILARSTPEGARDFLVPARLQKGRFYALPQSPQLYKQMLMVAGVDRYFQLARCLRDEDLRADRQPEHTQIDLEMALARPEDVFELTEGFVCLLFREILGVDLPRPFPRMSYSEAVARYGSDKPDLRFGMELEDLSHHYRGKGFRIADNALEQGGVLVGIRVPKALSRKEIDAYTSFVQGLGAGGLLWFKAPSSGPLARFTDPGLVEEGSTLLVIAGPQHSTREIMGELRLRVARDMGVVPESAYKPLWITEFPLFTWNEDEGRIEPMHHVFTSPRPQDTGLLDELEAAENPRGLLDRILGLQYDLVINGVELGSGSVRCSDHDLQIRLLRIAGMNPGSFSFFLEALRHGAPPHAGIALGFDRLVAMLAGAGSIREVIAFPKTTSGAGLLEGSPSEVSEDQLGELGLRITKIKEKKE